MRVAVNAEQLLSPSPGGVGRYAAKLMANLVALGVEVVPVVARHTHQEIRAAWADFALDAVPAATSLPLPRPALYDAWHLLDWPPLTNDPRVDVVHARFSGRPSQAGEAAGR